MARIEKVTLTVPTTKGTRTIEGKRVTLAGLEAFSLVIHKSIAAPSRYTITEETTGLSLCTDFERHTSQVRTIAATQQRMERFKVTAEKFQLTVERHRHKGGPSEA